MGLVGQSMGWSHTVGGAVPGLGVEPADVLARTHAGVARRVREHAHEAVAGGEVDAGRAEGIAAHGVLGRAVRDVVRLGDRAAEPVARRRVLDEAVGKGGAFEAQKQRQRGRQRRPCVLFAMDFLLR